ncbi:MAG: DUF2812 domain-containing protein [Oscillospiraceae bacterium]|nr:DUF2812 domain-containing protein [Oscillospiraceae bacterium]
MKYRYRFHPSEYALGETEQFYSDMEARGWRLVKRGGNLSKFEPTEPGQVRYRIEVSAPGFLEEANLSEGQLAVFADCGWEYVGSCGLLHIFRSPAGSGAPEFYTDPRQQAATLKKLKRNCIWGWTPAVFMLLFQWSMGFAMQGERFWPKFTAQFYRSWIEHTAILAACCALLAWGLVLWIHDTWQISRTYYRMKKGQPLDHNPKNRHLIFKAIHRILLAVAAVFIVLAVGQLFTTVSSNLPETPEGPFLRLHELGWEGEPGSFMGKESGAMFSRSLLADHWDTVEYLGEENSLAPWIYQDVYRLRDPSMAEALAQALMTDATFGGEFRRLEIEGLDAAWATEGLEILAVKGELVACITYLPDSYDSFDPQALCTALAQKWA